MTLVDFLLARLAEDEGAALLAKDAAPYDEWDVASSEDGRFASVVGIASISVRPGRDIAEHIARHDPARVLAEVAAKRRIVDECALETNDELWEVQSPEPWLRILRSLALPFASHPDYDEGWRP